jgi:hypothetical protein
MCVWQVAQQEAQRAAFVVERAKQERQQKIVQAEGEAEAAKMISFKDLCPVSMKACLVSCLLTKTSQCLRKQLRMTSSGM